jgi:hypothetical protein
VVTPNPLSQTVANTPQHGNKPGPSALNGLTRICCTQTVDEEYRVQHISLTVKVSSMDQKIQNIISSYQKSFKSQLLMYATPSHMSIYLFDTSSLLNCQADDVQKTQS